MLEALLLILLILLLPLGQRANLLWPILAVLIVIPGMYATWYGAPFVPTPKRILKKMLSLAAITPGQVVYDLGCGDGRLVFAAAKKKARAIGYELSLPTYLLAKIRSLFHRGSHIRLCDFWKQDYRDADVVFCYLLTNTMQTFKTTVWPQLKPGCKVISHNFRMNGVKAEYDENKGVVMYVK